MIPHHIRQKAFGQNYLKSQKVINTLISDFAESIQEATFDRIVEIGPGKGAITYPLREKFSEFPITLVEKDRKLIDTLTSKCESDDLPMPVIINEDFLELDLEKVFQGEKLVVIGNLPYSVATPILVKLTEHHHLIERMHLMFQQEVAEKVRIPIPSKKCGSLSVYVQNLWITRQVCRVSPNSFRPAPKIWSEVVGFSRREAPMVSGSLENSKLWNRLLKTAFTHRRKMLRSSISQEPWKSILKESTVDPSLRAQALDWNDWKRLMDSTIVERNEVDQK